MSPTATLSNTHFVLVEHPELAGCIEDLVKGLEEEQGLSAVSAEESVDQLIAFMRLKGIEPGVSHSPSVLVDRAWHVALRHPQYSMLCEALIGDLMVHNEVGHDVIRDPVAAVTFTVSRLRHQQLPIIESCWQVSPSDVIGCSDNSGGSSNGSRPPMH